MQTLSTQTTLNAMKARQQLGEVLDMAFYQGRSFLIERAGKPVAAVIPARLYEAIQTEVRQRFGAFLEQARTEFSDLSDNEKQKLLDEAVRFAKTTPTV